MKDAIDREENTVSFERSFAASCEDVFDAWTKPEQISQWWDPTGAALVSCSIDLRPGGAFRFETLGHAPPFEGTYKAVDRPTQLIFDAMGALGTVSMEAKGASTLMKVTIRCASAEHFEMFLKLGIDKGTSKTLDQLVGFLKARAQQSATPSAQYSVSESSHRR